MSYDLTRRGKSWYSICTLKMKLRGRVKAMQVELSWHELELLHFCVNKEAPPTWRRTTPEEVALADLEARLASILSEESKWVEPVSRIDLQEGGKGK